MLEQDVPLDSEPFDMAATRPALTLGLPHTLSASLLFFGLLFLMLYHTGNMVDDTIGDVVGVGADAMIWSAAKVMLRADYHGWGNFIAWIRRDARCLDTAEWGGARLSPFPLRSIYRCEAHDAV